MTSAETLFARWGHRALLTVIQGGLTTHYPVVAVFDRARGYVAVRPGYDDPYGAPMPLAHYITGTTTQPSSDTLRTERGGTTLLLEPVDADDPAHVREALARWEARLEEQGTTPEAEREALRAELQHLGT